MLGLLKATWPQPNNKLSSKKPNSLGLPPSDAGNSVRVFRPSCLAALSYTLLDCQLLGEDHVFAECSTGTLIILVSR